MATRVPLEPIHSAPYDAIPLTPGESSAPANEAALRDALAPLELGSYDERILAWLVTWESTTVAVICSWLHRVREVGRD